MVSAVVASGSAIASLAFNTYERHARYRKDHPILAQKLVPDWHSACDLGIGHVYPRLLRRVSERVHDFWLALSFLGRGIWRTDGLFVDCRRICVAHGVRGSALQKGSCA